MGQTCGGHTAVTAQVVVQSVFGGQIVQRSGDQPTGRHIGGDQCAESEGAAQDR